MRRSTVAENFDRSYLVDKATGCWHWLRAADTKGHGVIRYAGRQITAAVFAFLRREGKLEVRDWPVFPVGFCLVNKCGTADCCNPEHHYVGTRSQAWLDKPAPAGNRWDSSKPIPRREEAAA